MSQEINSYLKRDVLAITDRNIFRPACFEHKQNVGDPSFKKAPSRHQKGASFPPFSISESFSWKLPPMFQKKPTHETAIVRRNEWWGTENDSCDGFLDLPDDFIPPRHAFEKRRPHEKASEITTTKQETVEAPPQIEVGILLREQDVVCGRGAPTMVHPGNQAYRTLIQEHETEYITAKRTDKPVIATRVLELLKINDVRFVRRERNQTGPIWIELDETKVYEKVCQSLREGAPELRRKMLASDVRKKIEKASTGTYETHFDQENFSPCPV